MHVPSGGSETIVSREQTKGLHLLAHAIKLLDAFYVSKSDEPRRLAFHLLMAIDMGIVRLMLR